jgi:protein-tyrosine sulfotransferase
MSSPLPIVIIGCPRSGTTLLRRLINAHPRIDCVGESFLLRAAVRFLSGETVAEGIDYGPLGGLGAMGFSSGEIKQRLRDFTFAFHEDIAARSGKPRFAIKTAVDSFYLPQILDLLRGHARIVCLVRHGCDVAISLREFTETMEGPIDELMPFIAAHRRLMPSFAAAWAKVTTDMLDAAEQYPDDVFGLRYEDLIAQPEDVLAALFDFLEEPCDIAALLDAAFTPGDVVGLGDYKTFATRALQKSSIERWRSLPDRVLDEMAPIANPVLERAGYDPVIAEANDSDAMRRHELAMMYHTTRDDAQ